MRRADKRTASALGVAVAAVVMLFSTGCAASPAPETTGTTTQVLGMDAVLDVPYTDDETALELDLYLPSGLDEPAPVVLLLHGGGFASGERNTGGMQRIAEQIVKNGYIAASIDYSLAPAAPYPAAVDDTLSAVAFLQANADEWGIDADRVALLGSSAGATIALQAGVQPTEETGIDAVVSLSGVGFFDPGALALGNPGSAEIAAALQYLGCEDAATCEIGQVASPGLAVTSTSSPAFLANGVGEIVPEQQSEELAAAFEAAGVPVELVIVPEPQHAAELLSSELWSRITAFLAEHLGEATS